MTSRDINHALQVVCSSLVGIIAGLPFEPGRPFEHPASLLVSIWVAYTMAFTWSIVRWLRHR